MAIHLIEPSHCCTIDRGGSGEGDLWCCQLYLKIPFLLVKPLKNFAETSSIFKTSLCLEVHNKLVLVYFYFCNTVHGRLFILRISVTNKNTLIYKAPLFYWHNNAKLRIYRFHHNINSLASFQIVLDSLWKQQETFILGHFLVHLIVRFLFNVVAYI